MDIFRGILCVCIYVCVRGKGGATSSEEAQVQPQTSPNDMWPSRDKRVLPLELFYAILTRS